MMAGLLVIFGVGALVFVALQAANIGAIDAAKTYQIKVRFENLGGIKQRSAVRSSGILVGRVDSVLLDSDIYEAVASLSIEETYRFPADSIFSIVSTNLLGDQYVNIVAGGADEMLENGDSVLGNSALILEDLIGNFLVDTAEKE